MTTQLPDDESYSVTPEPNEVKIELSSNEDTEFEKLIDSADTVDLPLYTLTKRTDILVDLGSGKVYSRGCQPNMWKPIKQLTKPVALLFEKERRRYYFYVFAATFILNIQVSQTNYRICEASIVVTRDKGLSHSAIPHPGLLDKSELSLLLDLWKYAREIFPLLVLVGDRYGDVSHNVDTGNNPTSREITQFEALNVIKRFLCRVFAGAPPADIDKNTFCIEFLRSLSAETSTSRKVFDEKCLRGMVNFDNGFQLIENYCMQGELLSHDNTQFLTNSPTILPYVNLSFDSQRQEILLPDNTQLFLTNLCCDDDYIMRILRAFLRTVISSRGEGRMPSCVWVWGPAKCGKSLWARLAQVFCRDICVQEFSKTKNQLTSGELDGCRLLLLDDVTEITDNQLTVLKLVLGCDTFSSQEKHKNGFAGINPNCQVLVISNYPPSSFSNIRNDSAIMDKIIEVNYPKNSGIPQELQTPNINIDIYVSDIYNWALSLSHKQSLIHLKSLPYQEALRIVKQADNRGMAALLTECFYYTEDDNQFVSMNDFKKIAQDYIDSTGDNDLVVLFSNKSKGPKSRLISQAVLDAMVHCYGKEISYGRRKTQIGHKGDSDGIQRPMGFFNIVSKEDCNTLSLSYEVLVLQDKKEKENYSRNNTNSYLVDIPISWLRGDLREIEATNQRHFSLKKYRESLKTHKERNKDQ